MTQEDKELLLKDLCARLPYGVKVCAGEDLAITLKQVDYKCFCESWENEDFKCHSRWMFPYLRPISSMTDEEKFELQKAFNIKSSVVGEYGISSNNAWWVKDRKEPLGFDTIRYTSFCGVTDYLNSIHVDYRGLIEKGLALEASEGMYDN